MTATPEPLGETQHDNTVRPVAHHDLNGVLWVPFGVDPAQSSELSGDGNRQSHEPELWQVARQVLAGLPNAGNPVRYLAAAFEMRESMAAAAVLVRYQNPGSSDAEVARRIPYALRTVRIQSDARNVWTDDDFPGGFVCSVCREPTESEPCRDHQPVAYEEHDR